jgi:hypothetical protein
VLIGFNKKGIEEEPELPLKVRDGVVFVLPNASSIMFIPLATL